MRNQSSERGIALVLVLVILPLVAIIMVQLHFETTIGDRLARNILANRQFIGAIRARREQIQLALVRDLVNDEKNAQEQGGSFDHYSDDWGPETEGGSIATVVHKGDKDKGDDIEIFTEIIDEQGKFNINLLRHTDPKRRGRAIETLVHLLDFFRESRFGDLEDSEYDLTDVEAKEVADAITKFVRGEERDERIPKSDLPQPTADMKQGILTVEDLVFSHRLFLEKRLMDRFTDVESNQVLPSLTEFITIYGDGKINANTAPVAVLRALFKEAEGWEVVAPAILNARGGFLNTDEDQDKRREKNEQREQLKEEDNSSDLEDLDQGFKKVDDIGQVEGMNDAPFLRRNDIEIGRDFTVRSNFFTLVITAKRGNFMRQQRLVLERHDKGVQTRESEVRAADLVSLPEGIPGASASEEEEQG